MTRDLDTTIIAELPKTEIQVALLAALDFDSGWVRVWSGIGNLIFEGETFTGVGHLGTIAPIAESGTGVVANAITLQLAGIPSSLLALALTAKYQGRAAKIWVAFFGPTWTLLDAVLLFAGRMDTMQIDEGPELSTVTVSAESHLADLKRPRVRRFTHADQQELYPGDRGFEYMDALQNAEIAWGPGAGGGAFSQPPVVSSGTGGDGGTPGGGDFFGEPGGGDGPGDQGSDDSGGGGRSPGGWTNEGGDTASV